jgi:hypothetical protein
LELDDRLVRVDDPEIDLFGSTTRTYSTALMLLAGAAPGGASRSATATSIPTGPVGRFRKTMHGFGS